MELSDEKSARILYNGEEPGDDKQKLGLGFPSMALDEDDEAQTQYEKKLIEEIEGLVLGVQRLGEIEEGFDDDDDDDDGFNGGKNSEGYNGSSSNSVMPEEGFNEEGDVSFNGGKNSRGYDGNFSYLVRPEEGFEDGDIGFNGGKKSWGYNGSNSYPVRPDAEDCHYYMRVGSCKFGSSCKFNHPLRRGFQYPTAAKDKEGYSERPGKIECKYYMSSGGCKHGNACRFNHSIENTPCTAAVMFNFLGLPIRPGGTECPFYMRNGSCKFGSSCKFNHPEPTTVGLDAPSGYVNGGTASFQAAPPQTAMPSWSLPSAVNGSGSVLPVVYSPTNGVPAPNLEWNGYQAPVYPAAERRLPTPPALALNYPTETNFYLHHKLPMLVDEFPERPGEPDCSYFMKTGDCKYRSGCKFHHPKFRTPKSAPCTLSDKGLPLRPYQQVCPYYTRYDICKYGSACRYDHPVHHDN